MLKHSLAAGERERAQGDEIRRMGKEPGKSAEEDEQDRGRHSNLPFDETSLPRGERASRAVGNSKARPLSLPVEKRFRPAGLLASGSSAVGLLPGRATGNPISRVQWFLARGVPGDSGGGRAGFSPASLDRTESKNER
jgi:hypothetical protein